MAARTRWWGAVAVVATSFVVATPIEADADGGTARYRPVEPCRLADTRQDGPPAAHHELTVAGRCGVPGDAVAVLVGVVATDAPTAGYVSVVDPGTTAVPATSFLNHEQHQARANTTVARVHGGRIAFHTSASAHLVVDVMGWFEPAERATTGRLVPLNPTRAYDSRSGRPLTPGDPVTVAVSGAGVPADASAVAVNITVADTEGWGYLAAWAAGAPQPSTSSVNYDAAGQVRAVTTILPVTDAGIALATTGAAAHVIVDVAGYFTGPSAAEDDDGLFVPGAGRALDTRGSEPVYADRAVEIGGLPGAAALVNVTVLATSPGWLRATPAGVPSGGTSSVNGGSADSPVVANAAIVALSTRGIEVYASEESHALVDVIGTFTGDPMPATLPPRGNARPAPSATGYPQGRCDTMNAPGLNDPTATPDEVRRIGTSVRGRPIQAEHYGELTGPQVLVVAQVHGNECSPQIALAAVRHHAYEGYGVWVIPTLNPDGHAAYTRQNANGVDLNTDGLRRAQPETRALLDITAAVRPVLTIHVHSPNGYLGRHNGGLSEQVGWLVSAASGLRLGHAGVRTNGNWFLWQAQEQVIPRHPSLLVELHAVTDAEVPNARPRPPKRSVAEVRTVAEQLLVALDRVL